MKIIKSPDEMQHACRSMLLEGKAIGFVPTMGYLHDGHLSLMRKATEDNHVVAVSIFVNPTQFGPHEDLKAYPSDMEGDIQKLETAGVDLLFTPLREQMYSDKFSTTIDVGPVQSLLCGRTRPGHFNGVATVVAKLLNIVQPARAYFGSKDYQQALIIKNMVRDLNFNVEIVICPTVRDSDGLAMSSRNSYLSAKERKQAAALYKALKSAESLIRSGHNSASHIYMAVRQIIESEGLTRIDYISIVHPETLQQLSMIQTPVLLALAVWVGNARLIDNLLIE
jgi:pantoate--beta-alanine ligase